MKTRRPPFISNRRAFIAGASAAAVAQANKTVRIAWAVMRRQEDYRRGATA